MKLFKRKTILYLTVSLLLASFLTAGCSSNSAVNEEKKPEPKASVPVISREPVTLSLYLSVAATDEEVQEFFVEPTQKAYPNIKLEIIKPKKGLFPPDLVAAGTIPDIFYFQNNVAKLQVYDIPLDLRDLMKKYNVSLDKVEPDIMNLGPKGEVYGFPFSQNTAVLWYNKSIFDKFSVPYPKDGITWEQTVDLTRRLTRQEGGVQYYGFHPYHSGITGMHGGISLPTVDTKTDKVIVSPQWADIFRLTMDIFDVPGNKPMPMLTGAQARERFVKEQNLAMIVHFWNEMMTQMPLLKANNVSFDMVAPPRYAATPNAKYRNSYSQLVISKSSKYPDQAFQVLKLILSDEIQGLAARKGRIPMLANDAIKKQFGKENPDLQGLNINALFPTGKIPPLEEPSPYTGVVNQKLLAAFNDVYSNGVDINTALRKFEDEGNMAIQEEKAK